MTTQAPFPGKPDIAKTGDELDLDKKTFADFGVTQPIVEALSERGIIHPFPIQALTLPVALRRQDIIGQAKTGTGKTLGFGIPALEAIDRSEDNPHPGVPQALIIAPTRELAVQVASDLKLAGKKLDIRVTELTGGKAYEPQIKALNRGTDVVVGTPGRVIDLLKQKVLDLSKIKTLVLDEADEMLDLGFLEDVEKILAATPANRHTMLFSATMPGPIVAMARRYMTRPTHIRAIDPTEKSTTVADIQQFAYRCHQLNKIEVLARIVQAKDRELTMVFTRTKRQAASVASDLTSRGFAAGAIHGDLGQGAREQALRAFRNGKIDILVATDVAARGIDVDNVTHVINYQCPDDDKTYVHRVGRTGRAGHTGTAITFVDWEDLPRWSLINKSLDLGLNEPAETYHTSDHLYEDLDIPTDITGRLPRSQRTREGLDAEKLEDVGETGKKRRGNNRGAKNEGRHRKRRPRRRTKNGEVQKKNNKKNS